MKAKSRRRDRMASGLTEPPGGLPDTRGFEQQLMVLDQLIAHVLQQFTQEEKDAEETRRRLRLSEEEILQLYQQNSPHASLDLLAPIATATRRRNESEREEVEMATANELDLYRLRLLVLAEARARVRRSLEALLAEPKAVAALKGLKCARIYSLVEEYLNRHRTHSRKVAFAQIALAEGMKPSAVQRGYYYHLRKEVTRKVT